MTEGCFGLKNRQPGWEDSRRKEKKQKIASAERNTGNGKVKG